MALYFGYKKSKSDTEDLEKDISALKTGLATNNTKTKSLETSVFKKDGSTQMTGDLDLGDNSIVGIHNINADNSVSSKKYITDELAKKLSLTGGTLSGNLSLLDGLIMFSGMINMANQRIRFLPTPSVDSDASTKKYVDDKVAQNATKITQLAARVIPLEISHLKIYTYHFTFFGLGTSYAYPRSHTADGAPEYWMLCSGMTSRSKFHIHNLVYDNDSSIESSYTFTFSLSFRKRDSSDRDTLTLFSTTVAGKKTSSHNILCINQKANITSSYFKYDVARLGVKGSSAKGNEVTVSCSFEI